LFVGNDTVANFLFVNRGNGKFEEVGLGANVGYSAEGRARSGMGVDSADYDQDGWMDLFVTNVDQEMYSLYHNNRDETFDDMAVRYGIGKVTRLMSGWGVKFFDYDNDGTPLLLKNQTGHLNHWLGARLMAKRNNPDAVGALVSWQAGDLKRSLFKAGGGSYLASHDPRIVMGIGKRNRMDWVEVRWPSP